MSRGIRRRNIAAIIVIFVLAIVALWAAFSKLDQAHARAERIRAARAATSSVFSELLNQESSIRAFVRTRDKASLAPYLAARRTFDAQLGGLGPALSDAPLPAAATAQSDARNAYRVWLSAVARPIAYVARSRASAARLQRRGDALMDRMRSDFDSIVSAIDAAQVELARRMRGFTAIAAGVAAIVATLLVVLVLTTELRRQALAAEWGQFFQTADELLGVASFAGHIVRINPAWQRTLGYAPSDMDSRPFTEFVHPDDRGATAYEMYRLGRNESVMGFRNRCRAKNGAYHLLVWNAVPDASRRLVYLSARDETDQVKVESELAELSYADHLTGLPNRRHFVQQLHRAINMAQRHRLSFWVLYFDLDGLKEINDTLGHAAGDDALRGMVVNISSRLRESDLFARVGGDEFAILTPPIALPWDVEAMAQKIVDAASFPIDVSGNKMKLAISLGIAAFPEDGNSASDLISAADYAMYAAKRTGGSKFSRYGANIQESPPSA